MDQRKSASFGTNVFKVSSSTLELSSAVAARRDLYHSSPLVMPGAVGSAKARAMRPDVPIIMITA